MSLYDAGQAQQAGMMLDGIPDEELCGLQLLERVALEIDIDAELARDRRAQRRRRLQQVLATASGSVVPFVQAALQINDLLGVSRSCDEGQLSSRLTRTLHFLDACEAVDSRAAVVRARLLSNLAIVMVESGQSTQARDAIGTAARVIEARDDVPVSLRALVHAHRAYVDAAAPETLVRSAEERERALTLGRAHALPRAIWIGLYLRIVDLLWQGENAQALADACELWNYVELSDSRAWRDIASTRLSNAYSALGRFDDAERAIRAAESEVGALGFAMQRCAVAHRRGYYGHVLAQSALIHSKWPRLSQRYRANALLFSADAANRLGDTVQARIDIDAAVSITDSQPPALYIAQRIYALAHRLTGRKRYRDAADDLQHAAEAVAESPEPQRRGLTRRQREVAALAAQGASNREIAARLNVSARTVANHLAAAFAEFGIRARWQLPANLESSSNG